MSALGRGLGSLIPGGGADSDPGEPASVLPVSQIRPNPNQPRKVFDSGHLEDLKDSIKQHGILQPICVRPIAGGGYEIVSGERRWRAARLAGLAELPVVVREVDDRQMLELALVENVQRQDLDPIEKARGFQEMIERLGITQEAVAEKVGLKRATVANHLRLLDLPDEAQEAVVTGLITMGHARALAGLGRPAEILSALGSVVRDELSVRQTESLVRGGGKAAIAAGRMGRKPSGAARGEAWIAAAEARVREALGCQVQIQNRRGFQGQVVLRYTGREELDRLLDALAPRAEL